MSLIYFHRFLIISFIFFCLFFAWHCFSRWQQGAAATQNLVLSVVAVAAAVGFAFYLKTVRLRPK